MAILSKIFGDANEKCLKKLRPLVDKINGLESEFQSFSNERLQEKTRQFKERLVKGESLDDLLPESFALVREASKRTLGQRHYDVQLIGGIVLHQGKIAEMKTGEGKTLAATLPLYLQGLAGKGCHLVTVNDYLAKRDTVWMGQIYHALGLSAGCIVHDNAFLYDAEWQAENDQLPITNNQRDKERDTIGGFKVIESYLRPCSRQEAYQADIIYGTNNEFGFDYLRDNMAYDITQQVQTGFHYAIIDEVDSILVDEARTPLIISAPDIEASEWYKEFAKIIPRLNSKHDYEIDEKQRTVTLTEPGIDKVEKILGLKNIYQEKGSKYLHHLEQALRAQAVNSGTGQPLFARDTHYVVKDGQVIIVDEFTGRLMPGRRWSGGLHQAIEAKEGVRIQPESMTLASITFQNYFRMYEKLSGMTGTALTSAEEFDKVYGLPVVVVPTNKPMIRQALADRIYKTEEGKFKAVVEEIKQRHQKGQPVLVGTRAIEKNEYLGRLLGREGIAHQILNAKHHEKEGQIIAQAGKLGAVTIATNMAGRGVDIVLGGNPSGVVQANEVKESGGLHVIGTERHEARRIDNQLRGRSGRQGDPGSSQFFISLEDDLMRIFGGERVKGLMERLKVPEDQPIELGLISKLVENAQAKVEGMNFDLRKHILEYDDVMNKHREVIYRKRREILKKVKSEKLKVKSDLRDYILKIIKKHGFSEADYEKKEKEIGPENMRYLEKAVCLRLIDSLWMDHLYNMEHLRSSVRLRAYGGQDPLVEYKREGREMFQNLLKTIETSIAQALFRAQLKPIHPVRSEASNGVQKPVPSELMQFQRSPELRYTKKGPKVGRNQPCPCGSGKKYKKCCLNK